MHLRLAEYDQARARYEEARPIYAGIGARLGEANTIKALGDVHLRLAEYDQARARYEEAWPVYAGIGGEATRSRRWGTCTWRPNTTGAGAVRGGAADLRGHRGAGGGQHDPGAGGRAPEAGRIRPARARYEEARPVYAGIGDRLGGEANTIRRWGTCTFSWPNTRRRGRGTRRRGRSTPASGPAGRPTRSGADVHPGWPNTPPGAGAVRWRRGLCLTRAIGDLAGGGQHDPGAGGRAPDAGRIRPGAGAVRGGAADLRRRRIGPTTAGCVQYCPALSAGAETPAWRFSRRR